LCSIRFRIDKFSATKRSGTRFHSSRYRIKGDLINYGDNMSKELAVRNTDLSVLDTEEVLDGDLAWFVAGLIMNDEEDIRLDKG